MTEPQLSYDPETGIFVWIKANPRRKVGNRAGSSSGHGYRKITVNYIKYYEHHLAWYYVNGVWPEEIDHINGNGEDNRISNLRLCTRSQNNFNAYTPVGASGLKGAYLDKRVSKWYSKIQLSGRQMFLGYYNSAIEAHKAYMAALNQHVGDFALHNRP